MALISEASHRPLGLDCTTAPSATISPTDQCRLCGMAGRLHLIVADRLALATLCSRFKKDIRRRLCLRQAETYPLFSEDFLHLADFVLDLSTYVFDLAFGFQVGIVRSPSNLLFDFAFHLVKLSFCSILSALLHGLSPLSRGFCEFPAKAFNRQCT